MELGIRSAHVKLPDYPVLAALPALRKALTEQRCAVLSAPPGSGKTTVVPLALLEEPWLKGRRILMLEPRRIAARTSARRMAHLCGEAVGKRVGYQIRFERHVSAETRVEVITEGLLTRRLQADPELPGVGLVIFDEFHERSLDADLALALTLDAREHLNPDLRVLVMSATLDTQRISALLDGAPVVEAGGKMFAVTQKYLGQKQDQRLEQSVSQAVQQAMAEQAGDVLVFLPGAREIRNAARELHRIAQFDAAIRPLYGDLSSAEQDLALMPDARGRRKVILATNIAQTSLTVEGVTAVVDAGLSRFAEFDLGAGANRLETRKVSRASADQRAGRAGRLAPGVAYRLWSQDQQGALPEHDIAEILLADLSRLALEVFAWGEGEPSRLKWLDAPAESNWNYACTLLRDLGAVDAQGRITAHGRDLCRLPTAPRSAHLLIRAQQRGLSQEGAWLVAALEQRAADDCTDLAEHVQHVRQQGGPAAGQFLRALGETTRAKSKSGPLASEHLAELLAEAYPERLAYRREGLREQDNRRRSVHREVAFQCADGGEARLSEHDALARETWLAIAHWQPGAQRRLRLAAAISETQIRELLAHRIRHHREVAWDAQNELVVAQAQERIGSIVMSAKPITGAGPAVMSAMIDGIRRMGLGCLPWTEGARQWQSRVLCLRQWLSTSDWPDVSDKSLTDGLEIWLEPYLSGCLRRSHLAKLDLSGILNAMLEYPQQQALAKQAPTHLTVPSGQRHALKYAAGAPPVLEVKLQEMFGSSQTPAVCDDKVRVVLHLLSPARRPIAVTDDLAGFWSRGYIEVRKEMRGRYPRHPWPEDPRAASATHRAKPRGS